MNDRNRRDVERVPCVRFKCSNPTLAENYLIVPAGHNVLGRKQQFFQRRCDTPLEQHRFLDFAQFPQQIEILHVAGADLQDVNVRHHHGDLRDFHDLADYQHVESIRCLA